MSSDSQPPAPRPGGTVPDIPYTHAFHPAMAPAGLALAAVLAGIRPPDLSGPFALCEPGFGQGVNLAVSAAAFPAATCLGTDLLAAHAAHAEGLATAAGLTNLSVRAEDFATFADRPDLPPLDMLVLHGVWTWVGPDQRAVLVRLIRERLKPGGLLYVSYNALPAWGPHMPLRTLLKAHADAATGPLDRRIRSALAFATRLAAIPGGYLDAIPGLRDRLADLADRPIAYLAHEYFVDHWSPQAVTDLAADLAPAGLRFVASAHPPDWLDPWALPAAVRAVLEDVADPLLRQLSRDTALLTPFRRDLFIRGPVPGLDGVERAERLQTLPFAALSGARAVPGIGTVAQGRFPLDRDLCCACLDGLLAGGPAGARTLLARGALPPGRDAAAVTTALVQLAGLGLAAPALPGGPDPAARRACTALNRHIQDLSRREDTIGVLASPVTGSGIALDRLERLFLLALAQGGDPVDITWQALAARGQGVVRDGRLLSGEQANRQALADRWRSFHAHRLPVLRHLGVVDGA